MTALCVIIIIVLLTSLLLASHLRLHIKLDDALKLRVGFGLIMLTLLPKKERTVELRDFTYKKHMKRLERERKKAEKRKRKNLKKAEVKALSEKAEAASRPDGANAEEKLATVGEIVKFAVGELSYFTSHLHADIKRLHITVGGEDAAQTAVKYGAMCASVALTTELLSEKTKLGKIPDGAVYAEPDFLSDKTTLSIDISVHISLFHLIGALFKALKWLIKQKTKQIKNNKQ